MKSSRFLVWQVAEEGVGALASYAWFANRQPVQPQALGGAAAAPAPGAAKPGGPPGAPGMAIGVEAVPARATTLSQDLVAVGTLRSNESVVLRPEIAGRIARIGFRDGERVHKGVLLVALDAAIPDAELQQAKASLALAQQNFRRTEDLFQRKFVSESAKDQAAANLKVAEANAALAQARLERTRIRAPFAGVVGIRNVSVGDFVKDGADLINLEDITQLKVDFRLPENALAKVSKGQTLEVSTDALPGQSFRATVDAIDPLIDSQGRAVQLRARLANAEGKLRPGMFARVRLIVGERSDVVVVPEEALVPQGAEQYVFRVAEGKAQRVKVRTGARRGHEVEIAEGLKAGDMVVTAGQLKIRDGVPVKLQPVGAAPAPTAAAAPATAKP